LSERLYFECLLLDLDGTLIDSKRLMISSVKYAVRQAGKRVPSASEIMRFYSLSTSPLKILRQFRTYNIEDYWEHYSSNISRLRLFDRGMKGKLSEISKAGIKLGLVTSLPREIVKAILKRSSLSKSFLVVKTYERRAPKWKLIDAAIRELRVDPFKSLYLGDMAGDVTAAHRANKRYGIWAGVAYWSKKGQKAFSDVEPDFIFQDFDEVVRLTLAKLKPQDNCLEPSRECYTPHREYLPKKLKVNRQSCRYCLFTSDCLNCKRFNKVVKLSPSKLELNKLSKQIGVTVSSCEWYYPRNYPRKLIKNDDSIDTRNVVAAFKKKNGEHYLKFRLGLSMVYHLQKLQESVPEYRSIELIVPVPSTSKKIKQRGFNPPEELSRVLSQLTHIPSAIGCLRTSAKRSRRMTRYESDWEDDKRRMMRNIRIRNVKKLAGKKILLVDDILTDGVTLSAYAQKMLETIRPEPEIVALTFGLTRKER